MSTSDGDQAGNKGHDDMGWPSTVDAAVELLLQKLSGENRETLRAMPEEELITLHHRWGMGIRNSFGMWQGNTALLRSCAAARRSGASGVSVLFPDEAAMVIIEAAWRRVREVGVQGER